MANTQLTASYAQALSEGYVPPIHTPGRELCITLPGSRRGGQLLSGSLVVRNSQGQTVLEAVIPRITNGTIRIASDSLIDRINTDSTAVVQIRGFQRFNSPLMLIPSNCPIVGNTLIEGDFTDDGEVTAADFTALRLGYIKSSDAPELVKAIYPNAVTITDLVQQIRTMNPSP
jgi:hypothetical protein